jgi:hypothetical protein
MIPSRSDYSSSLTNPRLSLIATGLKRNWSKHSANATLRAATNTASTLASKARLLNHLTVNRRAYALAERYILRQATRSP